MIAQKLKSTLFNVELLRGRPSSALTKCDGTDLPHRQLFMSSAGSLQVCSNSRGGGGLLCGEPSFPEVSDIVPS